MPYRVAKNKRLCPLAKPYAVTKKDDGSLVACHASVSKANSQIAAIYAHEGKGKK
jgi:hypothetical protein